MTPYDASLTSAASAAGSVGSTLSLWPFDRSLTDRLLAHLGFHGPVGPLSPDVLVALQRAFLAAVPYENLEIQLGRPTSLDPVESAERILTGRGGYCYHLNGAFATLLHTLGFDVTVVRSNPEPTDPESWDKHAVLLVDFAQQTWVADVGLGDGFLEPFPLVEGPVSQPPFRYRLEHLGGLMWRVHHDVRASLDAFDFDVRPVPLAVFERMHRWQSGSPESSFVRLLVLQMRRPDHTLSLRGCVLTRADADGRHNRDVIDEAEWWALVAEEFGVRLDGIDADARSALWQRMRTAHDAWERAGRPS